MKIKELLYLKKCYPISSSVFDEFPAVVGWQMDKGSGTGVDTAPSDKEVLVTRHDHIVNFGTCGKVDFQIFNAEV